MVVVDVQVAPVQADQTEPTLPLRDRLDLAFRESVPALKVVAGMAAIGSRFLADRRLFLSVGVSVSEAEALTAIERQPVRRLLTTPELSGRLDLIAVLAPLLGRS